MERGFNMGDMRQKPFKGYTYESVWNVLRRVQRVKLERERRGEGRDVAREEVEEGDE